MISPELICHTWPAELPPPVSAERAQGGWVATTWLVVLANGSKAVVKRTPFPAEAEVEGLFALAAAGVPVPRVLGYEGGTLVLERVSGYADWARLGLAIAAMHRVTHDRYGWHRDNRAGRYVQANSWTDDWPTFFVERRVRPHLSDPSLPSEIQFRLEHACDGPIQEMLPAHPPASLTHGDLWRGNIVNGRSVIDPEVSYADRELDLAYMQMSVSDPLPTEFWSAYLSELPLPDGYEDRRLVIGLHHRLLEVRHFGKRALDELDAVFSYYGW